MTTQTNPTPAEIAARIAALPPRKPKGRRKGCIPKRLRKGAAGGSHA